MARIGCVVMAAGSGSRFGGSKLTTPFGDGTLFSHALQAVPTELLRDSVVVSGDDGLLEQARQQGFQTVRNSRPHLGISRTIALGMEALPEVDAILFLVADQPLLRRETVERLLSFYTAQPQYMAAVGAHGTHGNPVIFPAAFFPELLALQGDRGGGCVIAAHPHMLRIMDTDPRELRDVDTLQQLQELKLL